MQCFGIQKFPTYIQTFSYIQKFTKRVIFSRKQIYVNRFNIDMCSVAIHPRPRTKSNVWRINNENSPLEWPPSWGGGDSIAGNNGERGLLRPVYGNRARVLFDRQSRPPPVNYCRNFRNSIRFFFFFLAPTGRYEASARQNAYVTRVPTPWRRRRRRNYCFTAKRHVRIYCPANNYRSFSPPRRPARTGGRSRAGCTWKRVGSEHATWPLGTPPKRRNFSNQC